ncbi:neprilysin-11 [Drosophila innubila]|uniref:neprilysin-11 n=1 Tax=Drosophila innubila TaxID=198719 RepID=UPI00148D2CF0|nr:neprilysin-11 [Drosophila innubila]
MDVSKSACENFHEHACGNWHAPYRLRALGAHDMRSKLRALNKQLLVRHFEQHDEQQDGGEQQLFSFYGSCMSSRQSLHVYMDAVQQVLPDWPLLNNATQFDWPRGNAAVRRFGAQGLWRLLVQSNWQAAEQRIFYLLSPSFELLGTSAESEFLYQRYLKYLLLELGLRVRRAAMLADQLVEFEQQLRRLMPASGQTLVLHAPQTLQQLAEQLPQLQLLDYFQLLLGDDYTPQLLLVADTEYLQRLQRVLSAADSMILSSWLLLQLPAHFELHLHEDATLSAQREHCLQQLNRLLPQQLAQLQLRLLHGSDAAAAAFLSRTQVELQQLFDSLKLQFERLINATPIFEQDAATQTLALQKLRAMRLLLPQQQQQQQLLPPQQQAQQQGQQQLQSDVYDAKLLRLSQAQATLQFRAALECLQLPCVASTGGASSEHSLGPLDVNVYYRLKLNAIELPLGLLREPLLATNSNSNSNCGSNADCSATLQQSQLARLHGGLGYMLAHEMMHGFDYDGINYDATGHVAGGQWPARAIIRYGLRAGCYLGARYSNATLTINENIADSEGLRLAFEAYRQQLQSQQTLQQTLPPQSDHSSMRSFFVAFAQNWCGHAAALSSGTQQQHASHWERVNNVLGNFPEFADTFDCKAGSLMHPPNKCRIW